MAEPRTAQESPGASNIAAMEWMRQYQTQKRVVSSENAVLRNIVKRAKQEGINVRAMIATVEATKLDPDEVVNNLRDQIRYMHLRRIPVSRENLFDGWDGILSSKAVHDDDIWTAEESGYRAGRHSAAIDECPYLPGTEQHVHWTTWWHKGQAAIAKELGPDTTVASTAREHPRRGRQGRIPGTERREHKPDQDAENPAPSMASADNPEPPTAGEKLAQQMQPPATAPKKAARKRPPARRKAHRGNGRTRPRSAPPMREGSAEIY